MWTVDAINIYIHIGVSCGIWMPLNAQAYTKHTVSLTSVGSKQRENMLYIVVLHWWNRLENRIRGKRVLHCNHHCRAIVRYDVSVIDGTGGTQPKTELPKIPKRTDLVVVAG